MSISNFNELLETPLKKLAFTLNYKKLLKRLSTAIGPMTTVRDVLDIDPSALISKPGVGVLYVDQLIDFKERLPEFFKREAEKTALFPESHSQCFDETDFKAIDVRMLEDIEAYLQSLSAMKKDIAVSRWGYRHPRENRTLIGSRYQLSRERIRQYEAPINAELPLYLTIQSALLWDNIKDKMPEELDNLLPKLAARFATKNLFYDFLDLCCEVEPGRVRELMLRTLDWKSVSYLFCTRSAPVLLEALSHELMAQLGCSKTETLTGIRNLEIAGKLAIIEQGVYPKKLSRAEAIAHVLMDYPDGLPWKDIARIVNERSCSAVPMNENRLTHGYSQSKYVKGCGNGVYRHNVASY